MEKSINVRGEIDKLEIGGAPLVLPKSEIKSFRSTGLC